MIVPSSGSLTLQRRTAMSPVSQETERGIAALFPPGLKAEVSELLVIPCGNNLPFCESYDEFQLERIRFSALKLSPGNIDKLKEAIKLAPDGLARSGASWSAGEWRELPCDL